MAANATNADASSFFSSHFLYEMGVGLGISIIVICVLVKLLQHWCLKDCCKGGWIVNFFGILFVGAPLFIVGYVFVFIFVIVHLLFALPYKVCTRGGLSIGFLVFNPLLLGLNMWCHLVMLKNPCFPICLRKYHQKVMLGVLGVLGNLTGLCCQGRRKKKQDMDDKDYANMNSWSTVGIQTKTTEVAEGVWCHDSIWNELVENHNSVLIVRKGDTVVFFSPASGDPQVYLEKARGANKVIIVVPNMWHHGGADLFLKIFKDRDLTFIGSKMAIARHDPVLDIKDVELVSIPGVEFLYLDGFAYDEYVMYLKEEKILAVCDIFEGGEPPFPLLGCFNKIVDGITGYDPNGCSFSYMKCNVMDERAFAKSLVKLQKFEANTVFGCHGGIFKKTVDDVIDQFKDYMAYAPTDSMKKPLV